jgi:hypothetical protein
MAAQLKLTVTKTDGSVRTFPVTPKVIVAFEREFKQGLVSAYSNDNRMEHTYWLAWKAEHAAGHVVKPFDGYLDDIVSVELEESPAPLDETL